MASDTHNSKLDETVKSILRNVDSNTETPDWQRMESMLGNAPRVNYLNPKYIVIVASSIVFLIICFMIFSGKEEVDSSEEVINSEPEMIIKEEPKKVEPLQTPVSKVIKEEPPVVLEEKTEPKEVKEEVKKQIKTELATEEKNESIVADKKEKKEKKSRKERDAKSEDSKITNNIGLNTLFNLNMDSIKKQKEKTEVVDSVN